MARGIGIFVTTLDPAPSLGTLTCVYGALFSALCAKLEAKPRDILTYLDHNYGVELVSKAEFRAQIKKESN